MSSLMFVYPFLRGVYLSLRPGKDRRPQPRQLRRASSATSGSTARSGSLSRSRFPTTVIVVATALFLAYGMRRGIRMERTITTILVLPISLGVILLSIGIQGFYGTRGWFNQIPASDRA